MALQEDQRLVHNDGQWGPAHDAFTPLQSACGSGIEAWETLVEPQGGRHRRARHGLTHRSRRSEKERSR